MLFFPSETDLIVGLISFVCCLFWALEYGILVGVGVEVLLVLYNTARPRITVQREQVSMTILVQLS